MAHIIIQSPSKEILLSLIDVTKKILEMKIFMKPWTCGWYIGRFWSLLLINSETPHYNSCDCSWRRRSNCWFQLRVLCLKRQEEKKRSMNEEEEEEEEGGNPIELVGARGARWLLTKKGGGRGGHWSQTCILADWVLPRAWPQLFPLQQGEGKVDHPLDLSLDFKMCAVRFRDIRHFNTEGRRRWRGRGRSHWIRRAKSWGGEWFGVRFQEFERVFVNWNVEVLHRPEEGEIGWEIPGEWRREKNKYFVIPAMRPWANPLLADCANTRKKPIRISSSNSSAIPSP